MGFTKSYDDRKIISRNGHFLTVAKKGDNGPAAVVVGGETNNADGLPKKIREMHPVCLTRLAPKRFGGQTESREKARSAPPTLVVSAAKKHAGGRRGGWHFFAMHPRPDLHAPPTVALHPVTADNRHRVSSGAGARRQRERPLHRVTGRAAADPLTATRRREKTPELLLCSAVLSIFTLKKR